MSFIAQRTAEFACDYECRNTLLARLSNISRITLIIMIAICPILIWAAFNVQSGAAQVHNWLPDDRIERSNYDRFVKLFGDDQFVLLSWNGCTIDDARLSQLRERIIAQDAKSDDNYFYDVETTATILQRLQSPPLELDPEIAKQRLSGFLLGKNGTACLVARVSKLGVEQGPAAIEYLKEIADQVTGLSRSQLIMAGTLFEEVAVDQASDRTLRYLVPPSTIAAITVAICVLRRWRSSLLVFLLAGLGQAFAVAVVYFAGSEFSAVMIVLPTLVFMLTLSSAVHLVNYYSDVAEPDHRGVKALLKGLRPTVLASMTTMIGMGSLAVSSLLLVRQFGVFSAVALGLATLSTVAIFPALADKMLGNLCSDVVATTSRFAGLARWTTQYATLIVVISVIALLITAIGASRLRASTKFDRMFPANSPTITGMQWIENNIGPIVAMEVLLEFPQTSDLLQEVKWVTSCQRAFRDAKDIGAVMSGADFMPPIPSGRGTRAAASRAAYENMLGKHLDDLRKQGWVATDDSKRTWRITCKVTGLDEDYGVFMDRLQRTADAALIKYSDQSSPPSRVVVTGLSPIAYTAQVLLLSDLGSSFLMAFALITPVMMLIARSFSVGLFSMLPNVLPVTIVFGVMGWFGIKIDIASILTASIALGIAVDDTLHFLSWYQSSRSLGLSTREAIGRSYHHCGIAMLETTLISCSAMLPFLFADFVPTQRFAMLMIAMLTLAIVGDMILLPALLVFHGRFVDATTQPNAIGYDHLNDTGTEQEA
jgi:uncharacterized protein